MYWTHTGRSHAGGIQPGPQRDTAPRCDHPLLRCFSEELPPLWRNLVTPTGRIRGEGRSYIARQVCSGVGWGADQLEHMVPEVSVQSANLQGQTGTAREGVVPRSDSAMQDLRRPCGRRHQPTGSDLWRRSAIGALATWLWVGCRGRRTMIHGASRSQVCGGAASR